ncbi:MAG TPA: FHA domain-containing protein [Leptospiraceae bacterium]|nr:FHA domain-containing protein [Leptospiraceae bacterium]
MIQCLSCKTQIPDDSAYCDQCAAPVLICPRCGTPGKGKFCTKDRTPLIQNHVQNSPGSPPATPAQGTSLNPEPTAPAPAQSTQPAQPPPSYAATMRAAAPGATLTLRHAAGINLTVQSGDMIGRREGNHAAALAQFGYISGKHGQFEYKGGQWIYADQGSTNGSQVNGQKLAPNVSAPLKNGDTLLLADQLFKVEIA